MNAILEQWNTLPAEDAAKMLLPCCGSEAWAREVAVRRPFDHEAALFAASDAVWWDLPETAWRKAFDSHPRIGQTTAQGPAAHGSLGWSAQEQRAAMVADQSVQWALSQANSGYEAKFGRIFIVCATGLTATEILAMLEARMGNDPGTELREAAEQQRQITQLRLRRWLEE